MRAQEPVDSTGCTIAIVLWVPTFYTIWKYTPFVLGQTRALWLAGISTVLALIFPLFWAWWMARRQKRANREKAD